MQKRTAYLKVATRRSQSPNCNGCILQLTKSPWNSSPPPGSCGLLLSWTIPNMSVLGPCKLSFWLCLLTFHQCALQYRQIAYPEMGSEAPRPHFFAVAYLRLLVSSLKARCEDDLTEKDSFNGSSIKFVAVLTLYRHRTSRMYALVSSNSMTCMAGKMERRQQMMMMQTTKKTGTMISQNSSTLRLPCTSRCGRMSPAYVHPTINFLVRSFTHRSWI